MRAFSTASGGVMFVPDEIEREQKPVSYKELAPREEKPTFASRFFGRRKKAEGPLKKAA